VRINSNFVTTVGLTIVKRCLIHTNMRAEKLRGFEKNMEMVSNKITHLGRE